MRADTPKKQPEARVLSYERPEEAFLSKLSQQQQAIIKHMVSAKTPPTVKEIATDLETTIHGVYKQIGRLMLTADTESMKKRIPFAVIEKVSENPAKFDVVREVKRLFARV